MARTTLTWVLAGSIGICLTVQLESAACGEQSNAASAVNPAAPAVTTAKPKTPPEPDRPVRLAVDRPSASAPPVERPPQEKAIEGRTTAIRLKHAPAAEVSNTLCEFLVAAGLSQTAVVVPDVVTNTLLILASNDRIEEIQRMVEQLDRAPKMVRIRALIAEVNCDTDQTLDTASTPQDSQAKLRDSDDAEKGTASLPVTTRELDFSVLDISETSATLHEQVRALDNNARLEILARPQIMTLENQPASIQVGNRVPRITGVHVQSGGRTNQVELENVGVILGVTPRVSEENAVVMEMDLEMSDLRENQDVVLSSTKDGPAIHSHEIMITTAQTTVTVPSGKTILLGGMTRKSKQRRVELVILLTVAIVE